MSCKRATATPDWSVQFDDATSFKAVVDAAAAVLHRVTFKVVAVKLDGRECEWYVLKVDGADMGMTCCVSARLYIEAAKVVAPDDGDIEFCIDCKHVQTALDSTACAHGTLSVEGHGDRLHIYVHDPTLTTQDEKSELKTFVDTETVTDVRALDFSTILEIDLSRLARTRQEGTQVALGVCAHPNIPTQPRLQGALPHPLLVPRGCGLRTKLFSTRRPRTRMAAAGCARVAMARTVATRLVEQRAAL